MKDWIASLSIISGFFIAYLGLAKVCPWLSGAGLIVMVVGLIILELVEDKADTQKQSMTVQELRVGNLIRHNHHKFLRESLRGAIVVVDVEALGYLRSDKQLVYEPIPLTPEILEKAGFKGEYGNGCIYFLEGFPVGLQVVWEKRCFAVFEAEGQISEALIEISFVHQLQNLYYSLTGDELEINL